MDIPIDARQRPIKAKYIDEETPMLRSWFVFGHHDDGTVDIADGQQDVLTHVPREDADRIVTARNAFVSHVLSLLCDY